MEKTLQNSSRIEVVDALRGFAVMAILLLHNIEHFIFPVYPTDSPSWLAALDNSVCNVTFALFSGKAYAIFSLLFGFTFYLQFEKMHRNNIDFGYRFLWRLLGLALLATLNAAFFPGGDVLMLYVVVGLVLFIVRKWSNKAILATAICCTLQPMEWLYYTTTLIDPTFQLPDYGVGAMYDTIAEVCKAGNWGDFLWCNVTLGQFASFMWAVGAGRPFQTAGLFLFGLYIGRQQLFVYNEKNIQFWTRTLIAGAILYVPLMTLHNMMMEATPLAQQTVGIVFDMWHKLAFTAVLIASFVLLYQNRGFQSWISPLRSYGRMSLTNYITQSMLGALIYLPVGLYLAPYCGYSVSLLIGIVTLCGQLAFCKWWMKGHKQGPLEQLWYKWTWGVKSTK